MAKSAQINIGINTQSAIKSIGDLNNELGGTITTVNDLKMASRALQEQLESTPVGTAQYEQLKNALIDVNTQIKNYDLSIEALDNEQLASEIKSVTGGIIDMIGGLSLLGISSSNLEVIAQKFAKVESISRTATGAIEAYQSGAKILNSILSKSGAAQAVLNSATATGAVVATEAAVAEGAQAVATTAVGNASLSASVKFKALTAAMMANPFVTIATAIIAVVGAIYMFSDAEEEAAEQTDKLNKKLDENLATFDRYQKAMAEGSQNYLRQFKATNEELLNEKQKEIDALERLETRTKAQNDDLKALYDDKLLIQSTFLIQQLTEAKEAARTEISINELKVEKIKKANKNLEKIFDDLSEEEKVKAQEKFTQNELEVIDLEAKIVRTKDLLREDYTGKSTLEKEFYNEGEKLKQDTNKRKLEIDKQYRKQLDDADKERRKKELDYITDKLNREKSASETLINLKASEIKDLEEKELKLQENTFSTQKDDLIKKSVERELKINEEKYRNLEISQADFEQNKIDINAKGVDGLNAKEKELYDYFVQLNDDRIKAITTRFTVEKNLTASETRKIIQTREQLENEYAKELELYDAQKIQDVSRREEEILRINQKYRDLEIQDIKDLAKAEEDVLTEKYNKDISNVSLTTEQRKQIDEQYALDKIKIAKNTSKEINAIEAQTTEKAKKHWINFGESITNLRESWKNDWVSTLQAIVQGVSDITTKVTNLLSQVFAQQSQKNMANIQEQYSKEDEGLKTMLKNREITQKQYDDKKDLLDQKKREAEKAQKRKDFERERKLSIVNSVMATALAVAKSIPNVPMMALAGVLGGAQTAIIASQKFTASRGGIVPGRGASNYDSVPSMLAPGESVINAGATARFAPLLSAINMSTGGVQLSPSVDFMQSNNNSNKVYNTQNQTVRAYVVENDITDSQRRVRRYEENSRF